MPEAAPEISTDALLEGRLTLRQPRRGHRAGTDAVLVAALAEPEAGDVLVDLGAGSGAVGLIVAQRTPGLRPVLVERDPLLAALARENLALNGLAERGAVIEADLLARRAGGLTTGMAAWVATNPPFSEPGLAQRSPEPRRAAAHELPSGGFRRWIGVAADLLRHRGRLALIQRADRLGDCLEALRPAFGSVRVWPVRPKAGEVAIRVLIDAVRGGRGPLSLEPALVLHGADGTFTPLARRLHAGETLQAALMKEGAVEAPSMGEA